MTKGFMLNAAKSNNNLEKITKKLLTFILIDSIITFVADAT